MYIETHLTLRESDIYIYIYIDIYIGCPSKFDIILKVVILKTIKSSSMKLDSLGVENHKFILGTISYMFNMCSSLVIRHNTL